MVHETGREIRWTFLTGHGHALIVITRDPNIRLREIAVELGVTERTAQAIVNDLVDAGYVGRTRVGNRSRYEVHTERPFRHPVERDHAVGELLRVLVADAGEDESAGRAPTSS
jgi:DNA-binding MarR family transcriptional regulator